MDDGIYFDSLTLAAITGSFALDGGADAIRPGMEGVGKIGVDRRKLAWIWTHALIDRLRLALWTWVS